MISKIGYINSIDYEGLINELTPLNREERLVKYWRNNLSEIQSIKVGHKTLGEIDTVLLPDSGYNGNTSEYCLKESIEIINKIKRAENHNKFFNKRFEVLWKNDRFVAFFYSSGGGTVLPIEYVEIEEAKDYSQLTSSQMKQLMGNSENMPENMPAMPCEQTFNNAQSHLEEQKKALEEAEKQAKEELNNFRELMRLKEQELISKQQNMLSELREKVEKMKDSIFLLEMNILALRTYFGETFSLTHIVKGKNAEEEIPLVIQQKFIFMDEDISRLTANSAFSTSEKTIIDLFSKYGQLFRDTFCPADKCITFFRASKDNKLYEYSRLEDAIQEFEFYHGNQIGMLIRNGDNLYISFIDEEITLRDNLFVSQASAQEEIPITENTKLRSNEARTVFNRKHAFLVLQALLNNTNIYKGISGDNIFDNPMVIFSSADAQIVTYKYPRFNECFSKYGGNIDNIKEGDEIFIDESHAGSKFENNGWFGRNNYIEEHRSVGYRNNARDADIDKGVNRINLIERRQDGYYVYFKNTSFKENSPQICNYPEYRTHIYDLKDIQKYIDDGTYVRHEENIVVKYYVSCKRELYFEEAKNNVNLRVYSDEFMSIMWINSNFTQQWIDSKDSASGKNYVYFVAMLKELNIHLQQRENEEFRLINNYTNLPNNSENRDILLNWKISNNVRRITEFQAKRFVKFIENSK